MISMLCRNTSIELKVNVLYHDYYMF